MSYVLCTIICKIIDTSNTMWICVAGNGECISSKMYRNEKIFAYFIYAILVLLLFLNLPSPYSTSNFGTVSSIILFDSFYIVPSLLFFFSSFVVRCSGIFFFYYYYYYDDWHTGCLKIRLNRKNMHLIVHKLPLVLRYLSFLLWFRIKNSKNNNLCFACIYRNETLKRKKIQS